MDAGKSGHPSHPIGFLEAPDFENTKVMTPRVIRALRSLSFGSDIFVLKVEAYRRSEATPIIECSLVGHGEAYGTGMVAAKVASLVCRSSLSAGVFHMGQIVDPVAFVKEVEKEGLKFDKSPLQEKKQ